MRAHYAMFFIDTLVYFMFTAGVLLLLRKHIKILRLRFLLRHRLKSVKRNIKELPPFYRYIRGVLFVSFKNPPGENVFIFSLVSLFLFIFSMSYRHFSFITSFGVACMGSLMPILLMLMKVESIRKKGSKEGISVIFTQAENAGMQPKVFADEIGGRVEVLDPLSGDYINNLYDIASKIAEADDE